MIAALALGLVVMLVGYAPNLGAPTSSQPSSGRSVGAAVLVLSDGSATMSGAVVKTDTGLVERLIDRDFALLEEWGENLDPYLVTTIVLEQLPEGSPFKTDRRTVTMMAELEFLKRRDVLLSASAPRTFRVRTIGCRRGTSRALRPATRRRTANKSPGRQADDPDPDLDRGAAS